MYLMTVFEKKVELKANRYQTKGRLLGAPWWSSGLERPSFVREVRVLNPGLGILFQLRKRNLSRIGLHKLRGCYQFKKLLSLFKIRGCLTVSPQREDGSQDGSKYVRKIMSTTCCQNNNIMYENK